MTAITRQKSEELHKAEELIVEYYNLANESRRLSIVVMLTGAIIDMLSTREAREWNLQLARKLDKAKQEAAAATAKAEIYSKMISLPWWTNYIGFEGILNLILFAFLVVVVIILFWIIRRFK
jgi:high-affinity Fe2+/Pb2+ permease